MAFDDFQKHCPECKKGEPCRKESGRVKHHLYVLKLRSSIREHKDWKNVDERYIEGEDCLYVGMSSHLPKCRASIHQNDVKGEDRSDMSYICYCKGIGKRKSFGKFTNGSKKVRRWNTFTFKPKLFKEIEDEDGNYLGNPIQEDEDPKDREGDLADHLRNLGYAVWAGEHYKPPPFIIRD